MLKLESIFSTTCSCNCYQNTCVTFVSKLYIFCTSHFQDISIFEGNMLLALATFKKQYFPTILDDMKHKQIKIYRQQYYRL